MKTAYELSKELIQKVTPRFSYDGENYESWKTSSRLVISDLLGIDKFEKVAPETAVEFDKIDNGVREIRFTFQTEKGYRVPCHLIIPTDVKNPPVMITLQGHSTGMHISLGRPKFKGDENTIKGGDRDFCVRAVKEGFAAIALEQRNFGECGGTEAGPNCFESALTNMLMGRTTIGERVWDVSRLIDVLETEFSDIIDVNNIGCMGNSGGGTATAYIAALDDRIKLAMPSCAVCTYKDSIGAMKHCACNYVPGIANYFDMNDLIAMSYPKYYIQVSGKEDPIFPLFAAEEMFNKGKNVYDQFGDGDKCALVVGNGGHRFYADDAWPIVHKFMK